MSAVPNTALTTPAMLLLWMQCAHGYSGCIGVLSSGCERHEPCAVNDIHLLCDHELAYKRGIRRMRTDEPEPGSHGLLGRSLCATLSAIGFHLVEVGCPFL